ncbi:MAG: pilin [Candidatus Paceibacterota bacterium]
MIKIIQKTIFTLAGLLLPLISFAQNPADAGVGGSSGKTATEILETIADAVQRLIPIVIGLGLLVFLWGILKYLSSPDPKSKKESIGFMTWGIISLFVMVSIWGIVFLLQDAFLGGTDNSRAPEKEVAGLKEIPKSEGSGLSGGTPILDRLKIVGDIVADVIPIVILLAVLLFLFGVLRYAFSTDAKNKELARSFMTWGIVAITVMVFVWGFVVILQQTIFSDTNPAEPGSSGEAVEDLTTKPTIDPPTQTNSAGGAGINTSIIKLMDIVQTALPLLVTIGIFLFLWGVFKYTTTENAKKKGEAVAYMTWGIILLLVLAGVWGFTKMIGDTVGINLEQQPTLGKQNIPIDSLIIQ